MTTAITITDRARRRVDKVASTFVSDSELLNWADHGHRELYDLLIAAYGQEYFLRTVDMFVSASTLYSTLSTYLTGKKTQYTDALGNPTTTIETVVTDFYKLIRFDRSNLHTSASSYTGSVGELITTLSVTINEPTANETRVPFRPFEFSDTVLSDTPQSWAESGINVRYRLSGDRIYWHPRPDAKQFVRMYYVPVPTTLTATTSVVDVWCEPWTEFVELYVARAIREKEQDIHGVQTITGQLAQVQQRILDTAPPRDAGQPQTIADTRGLDDGFGTWNRCRWPYEVY